MLHASRVEHPNLDEERKVLRIKRLRHHLVAVAAQGPVSRAIDDAFGTGDVASLFPGSDDDAAIAIYDADRVLVMVGGSGSALVLHRDGTFNWVDGGAVRFRVDAIERILLSIAPPMDWSTRCELRDAARSTPLHEMPYAAREVFGSDTVVLIGAEARLEHAEEAVGDAGFLELMAEVAELDHRATPAVVRRVAHPGEIQPPDAWRVEAGVFEAPVFRAPRSSGQPLEIIAVLGDPRGRPQTPPPPLVLPVEGPKLRDTPETECTLDEEPTLRESVAQNGSHRSQSDASDAVRTDRGTPAVHQQVRDRSTGPPWGLRVAVAVGLMMVLLAAAAATLGS